MKTIVVATFVLLAMSHEGSAATPPSIPFTSLGGSRISSVNDLAVVQRSDTDGYNKLDIYGLDTSGAMATGIMNVTTQAFSGMSFVAYGTVQSTLSAVGWQRHREVFAMKNNLIYHTTSDDNSNWTTWQIVPSQIDYICSAPSAVSWSPGRIDVFVMGCDYGSSVGALKHGFTSGGNVWSWEDRGGVIYSAPSAVSTGVGKLDVFAKGGSDIVYDDQWRNGWTWLQTPVSTIYPPIGLTDLGSEQPNDFAAVLTNSYYTNQSILTYELMDGGPNWTYDTDSNAYNFSSLPHAAVNPNVLGEEGFNPHIYVYYLVNNVIKRQGFSFWYGWLHSPSLALENNFDAYTVVGNPIPVVTAAGVFVFAVKSDGNIYYGLDGIN